MYVHDINRRKARKHLLGFWEWTSLRKAVRKGSVTDGRMYGHVEPKT